MSISVTSNRNGTLTSKLSAASTVTVNSSSLGHSTAEKEKRNKKRLIKKQDVSEKHMSPQRPFLEYALEI